MIKSIPTKYKGFTFRSRLEARWAVFFDNMGFDWVYEPEGYILENGESYLPDFLINDNTFVEVKPKDLTKEELYKARNLAKLTDKKVIFCVGVPGYKNYKYTEYIDERYKENKKVFIDLVDNYDCTLLFCPKHHKHYPFYYASCIEDEWDLVEFLGHEYALALNAMGDEKFGEKRW